MALDKATLKDQLKTILSNPSAQGNIDTVATSLADAFEAFVKSGSAVGVDSKGNTHNLTIQ